MKAEEWRYRRNSSSSIWWRMRRNINSPSSQINKSSEEMGVRVRRSCLISLTLYISHIATTDYRFRLLATSYLHTVLSTSSYILTVLSIHRFIIFFVDLTSFLLLIAMNHILFSFIYHLFFSSIHPAILLSNINKTPLVTKKNPHCSLPVSLFLSLTHSEGSQRN